MIFHQVEQGSVDWVRLRLGRPTASEFDQIITPAKGDLSSSATKYAHRLIAERVLNRQLDSIEHLEHVERGNRLEPEAVLAYEFQFDVETLPGGFVTTDDGLVGCSPDRVLPDGRGLLEIKCPSPQIHVGHLVTGPGEKYRPQVQGQLLIAEREYVDLWSYSEEMPSRRIRTERDEPYIRRMQSALDQFLDMLETMLEAATSAGLFQRQAKLMTASEAWAAQARASEEDERWIREEYLHGAAP